MQKKVKIVINFKHTSRRMRGEKKNKLVKVWPNNWKYLQFFTGKYNQTKFAIYYAMNIMAQNKSLLFSVIFLIEQQNNFKMFGLVTLGQQID